MFLMLGLIRKGLLYLIIILLHRNILYDIVIFGQHSNIHGDP